ncbi:MAG: polysaccharide deacetylase family protein [Blastocatellia bacterium]
MIKAAILNLMQASGAFDLMRFAARRQALILTYHRFSEGDEPDRTPARAFVEQLEYLTRHYRIVPLGRLVEHLNSPEPVPPGLAAITIDDGYRDAYEIAYPLLRRYEAPATLFVVAEFADRRCWIWTDKARYLCTRANRQWLTTTINGHESWLELGDEASRRLTALRLNDLLKKLTNDAKEEAIERLARTLGIFVPEAPPEELSPITWDQARELDRNGIEIGSHTMTHPILTNITDDQLRRELYESRLRLEEVLGRRVEQFCYPNGDTDERVQCEVARAGYRVAVTSVNGLNNRGDDPLTLRRVHTEHDLAHFLQSTSGFEQLKNKVRSLRGRPVHPQPVSFSSHY